MKHRLIEERLNRQPARQTIRLTLYSMPRLLHTNGQERAGKEKPVSRADGNWAEAIMAAHIRRASLGEAQSSAA